MLPCSGQADQLGIPADLPFDGLSKGSQHFPLAAPDAIVGHPHMHMAARSQVPLLTCSPLHLELFQIQLRMTTSGHHGYAAPRNGANICLLAMTADGMSRSPKDAAYHLKLLPLLSPDTALL